MHGELRGRGTARYANGDVYTGEFDGLARHGAGECKYGRGAGGVYEGHGWPTGTRVTDGLAHGAARSSRASGGRGSPTARCP